MNLSNIRISFKIFIALGVLALSAAVIGVVSINGLNELSRATARVDRVTEEIRVVLRLERNVIQLNRAEYWLAANPADYQEVAPEVSRILGDLEERLVKLEAAVGENQKRLLAPLRDALDGYKPALQSTLDLARRYAADVQIDGKQAELLSSVESSRAAASELRDAIAKYVTYTDEKGSEISGEASAAAETNVTVVIAVAVAGIVVGLGLGVLISQNGIVVPIRRIVDCLKRLADGDLQVEVYGTGRGDEVGDVAKTTLVFKDNMVRAKALEAEAEAAERRAEEERRRAMHKLADEFESTVTGVVRSVSAAATQMQASAQSLSALAEEANSQSLAVAGASEQASGNVQTVATAAEELSASIEEVNRQINASSRMAGEAVGEVDRTNGTVESLRTAAERIGDVVNLIQDIAAQTNLLALNATIEAARAGEAGKGFAVVASEVKSLATQTQRATEEIAGQIAAMQEAAVGCVEAIDAIGRKITVISESVSSIASASEQQASATQEIARNVQQAAAGTNEVSANITGVTQAAGETGRMSSEVLQASEELARQANVLGTEVDGFVARVRAG